MVAIFWGSDDVTLVHCVLDGANGDDCIPQWRHKRKEKVIYTLKKGDQKTLQLWSSITTINAPLHVTTFLRTLIHENDFEMVAHYPHSPDPAPVDIWVFAIMTDALCCGVFLARYTIVHPQCASSLNISLKKAFCCGYGVMASTLQKMHRSTGFLRGSLAKFYISIACTSTVR